MRDSFKVTFGTWSDDTPDDVVLAYKDAAAGFQTRDVRAKLPESESREPYNLTMIGIVDRDHAYAVAEGMSARNRWRRTLVDCTVEGMGHLLNQGDIVSVAHPRFKETASGVLDAWDEAGPALTLVCDMARGLPEWREDAPELYLSLTRPDGTAWGPVLLKGLAEKGDRYVATLDLADYIHVLSQGMESPFPWLTRRRRFHPHHLGAAPHSDVRAPYDRAGRDAAGFLALFRQALQRRAAGLAVQSAHAAVAGHGAAPCDRKP